MEICPIATTPKCEFKNLLSKCEALLPSNYVLTGLRIDKGFFSENNLDDVEDRSLAYVTKVPMSSNIRYYIDRIGNEQWKQMNEYTDVTRKKLLLDDWQHDRFVDILRIKTETDTGQMMFPDSQCYRYEAIVISELEQSPQANLAWYDGRGTAVDLIKECKQGFAVAEASQHALTRNAAYFRLK